MLQVSKVYWSQSINKRRIDLRVRAFRYTIQSLLAIPFLWSR
jgi:hypothetical protein